MQVIHFIIRFLLLALCMPGSVLASDPLVETITAKANRFENKYFRMRLISRTPNQIAAFYEARGFPANAIAEVRKVCFVTLGLGNKSQQKLYHDLSQWQFYDKAGPIKRILRSEWKQRWHQLELEKRFQSTFRWTLMPEKLDFYPQEGEGGNIIFPRTGKPITIKARIVVGSTNDPSQTPKIFNVAFNNIQCAEDPK